MPRQAKGTSRQSNGRRSHSTLNSPSTESRAANLKCAMKTRTMHVPTPPPLVDRAHTGVVHNFGVVGGSPCGLLQGVECVIKARQEQEQEEEEEGEEGESRKVRIRELPFIRTLPSCAHRHTRAQRRPLGHIRDQTSSCATPTHGAIDDAAVNLSGTRPAARPVVCPHNSHSKLVSTKGTAGVSVVARHRDRTEI